MGRNGKTGKVTTNMARKARKKGAARPRSFDQRASIQRRVATPPAMAEVERQIRKAYKLKATDKIKVVDQGAGWFLVTSPALPMPLKVTYE